MDVAHRRLILWDYYVYYIGQKGFSRTFLILSNFPFYLLTGNLKWEEKQILVDRGGENEGGGVGKRLAACWDWIKAHSDLWVLFHPRWKGFTKN